MDIFEQLLEDLSKEMRIPLKVDANHSCLIRLKDAINVQLELNKGQDFLIIGTTLGELAPGKFRENVLREALKENNLPPPKVGLFAYSERKNALILFEKRHTQELNGQLIHELIKTIYEKAMLWKPLIDQGNVPQSSARAGGAPFSHASIFDTKR